MNEIELPNPGRAVARNDDQPTPYERLMELSCRPDFNVATFDTLVALLEKTQAAEERRRYRSVMAEVHASLGRVVRDKPNPILHSRYASFEALDREVRPIISPLGVYVDFHAEERVDGLRMEGRVFVRGIDHHESFYAFAELDKVGSRGQTNKTNVQAFGSTASYLRRYIYQMAFNLVPSDAEDDDGEATRTTTHTESTNGDEAGYYASGNGAARSWSLAEIRARLETLTTSTMILQAIDGPWMLKQMGATRSIEDRMAFSQMLGEFRARASRLAVDETVARAEAAAPADPPEDVTEPPPVV